MDIRSETSSVAGSYSISGSRRSTKTALARAFLFQFRSYDPSYDPPRFTLALEPIVTYACGQLVGPPLVEGGAVLPDIDDEQDEGILTYPVLFMGYIEFNKQMTFAAVREWINTGIASNIEFEPAYLKDREQHIRARTDIEVRYRSKLDLIARAPWKFGASAARADPGARTDMEAIREILREHGPEEGIRQVAEKFPGQFIRYASGITQLAQAVIPRVRESEDFKFRPWQHALVEILKKPSHTRHIYWIEDGRGGSGKSRLTTYLCRELNAIELDGRQMDAAFSYTGQKIVLFDLARAVDAGTLKDLFIVGEKLKNGQIYSSKYQSRLKVFETPHVVYFSNSPPPLGVWSADRLQHIVLSQSEPFDPASHPIDEPDAPPEPTGADLFKQLLESEKQKRAEKRKREDS